MKQVHTHYDNLKVARDAPREVILAAYKTLSHIYHPDGKPESARILALINKAYEVLSDPAKRREHDLWIAQMEGVVADDDHTSEKNDSFTHQTASPSGSSVLLRLFQPLLKLIKFLAIWLAGGAVVVISAGWLVSTVVNLFGEKSSPPPEPTPHYRAEPKRLIMPEYFRPVSAPNGQPWPASAGYVPGYQRLHADGLSTVRIDNSQNDSDVVRPEGAFYQWREVPPRELSIVLVADERFGRAIGRTEAS